MGSGLSSDHRSRPSLHQPPASEPVRVIGADGSLREFQAASFPTSVSDVLGDGNASRFFMCSSDALYFDADAPALGADEQLWPGQIYFVLPAAMLGRPLSAANMAALAVRASEAMAARAARTHGRGRVRGGRGFTKVRVVPVRADGDGEINERLSQRTLGEFVNSLNTMRNGKRLPLIARPPVRRALSTVAEAALVTNGMESCVTDSK